MTAQRVKRLAQRAALALVGTTLSCFLAFVVLSWVFPFEHSRLVEWPASPIITDSDGRPLLTLVASDDQWRLPVSMEQMSPWLRQATIAIEDERFFWHVGVDPIAVARAALQNMSSRRVVSGASTLTMQTCRMLGGRPRTYWAKAIESFQAIQLETLTTKDELLEQYLNIAPYGGNLRGVEAASQAYFGKRSADLSLGEATILAGLPQSPSRLRPDRHPFEARVRRETVLDRMLTLGMITDRQRDIAAFEPLGIVKRTRITRAPHASWVVLQRRPQGGRTTIDLRIQTEAERIVSDHSARLPTGADMAVVVIDIATGHVVSLIGSADFDDPADGQVNGAIALRSPGSALKPFVYAAAFDAGMLSPKSTVYDVPIDKAGWSPRNFDHTFAGEITVAEALRRSLNVPAILVAEAVGLARCAGVIDAAGVKLPYGAACRGGLALVVGAVEVRLLDLTNGYATLGRNGVFIRPRLFIDEATNTSVVLDSNVCAAINSILSSRSRTPRSMERLAPDDLPWFMWKTGTSSGRRDAWAVGHNHLYAIGVWVGRFSGAGSVEFIGAEMAEPILASLFSLLSLRNDEPAPPYTPWQASLTMASPHNADSPLRIVSPSDGAVFRAISRRARVPVSVNHEGELTWFLNGRVIDGSLVDALFLDRGVHELRCVDPAGASSAVRFHVR